MGRLRLAFGVVGFLCLEPHLAAGPAGFPRSSKLLDLGLLDGSPAIDAAVVLPGINDEFFGAAPDIGAKERVSAETGRDDNP